MKPAAQTAALVFAFFSLSSPQFISTALHCTSGLDTVAFRGPTELIALFQQGREDRIRDSQVDGKTERGGGTTAENQLLNDLIG